MKHKIIQHINHALCQLQQESVLPEVLPQVTRYLEPSTQTQHGDFSSNIALVLAKVARCNPQILAKNIVALLPKDPMIHRVEVAGPGFINFFLSETFFHQVIHTIVQEKQQYGQSNVGTGRRVHIEYVSANPTGPLHVGHGRSAAYGDVVANLLDTIGFTVHREYYVNDAGRQMQILALSVWLRYLTQCGTTIQHFPKDAYQGDYIKAIAHDLYQQYGRDYVQEFDAKPFGEDDTIDAYISHAKTVLGPTKFKSILDFSLQSIQHSIQEDCADFGVTYHNWFYESQLIEQAVPKCLDQLIQAGHAYEKDGALWFRASQFGDEKDRVLKKKNGDYTYFTTDIAYHLHKYQENYDLIIDVFGADHHGYVPRIYGFLKALGCPHERLEISLVQFVTLYRDQQRLGMSTRSGEFITLRHLYQEVGKDAARFFYVMRTMDQALDFDMDLAKSHSHENPVYYIQYAHARICAVFRQLEAPWHPTTNVSPLTNPHELQLMRKLSQYPDVVMGAANARAPHHLTHYCQELANAFHRYYNAHRFLVDDKDERNARLCLITAIKQVLANALSILGIEALTQMPTLSEPSA